MTVKPDLNLNETIVFIRLSVNMYIFCVEKLLCLIMNYCFKSNSILCLHSIVFLKFGTQMAQGVQERASIFV